MRPPVASGYVNAAAKQPQPAAVSDLPQGRQPLCRSDLWVFLKGREDNRYFVLFEDTFEYWSLQADYERGGQPRGRMRNSSVVNLEATRAPGFIIFLESADHRLEVRCNTEQEQRLWLEQWNRVLAPKSAERKVNAITPQPQTLVPSASIPSFNAGAFLLPNRPDLACAIFMGSLTVDIQGKPRKRYFALFDNRLDYFETANAMRVERYPRGRILLRDIQVVEFQGSGFQVVFKDPELPTLVLLADRADLPMWETACMKVSLPCTGVNPAQTGLDGGALTYT